MLHFKLQPNSYTKNTYLTENGTCNNSNNKNIWTGKIGEKTLVKRLKFLLHATLIMIHEHIYLKRT
jgi:hypothetical protein